MKGSLSVISRWISGFRDKPLHVNWVISTICILSPKKETLKKPFEKIVISKNFEKLNKIVTLMYVKPLHTFKTLTIMLLILSDLQYSIHVTHAIVCILNLAQHTFFTCQILYRFNLKYVSSFDDKDLDQYLQQLAIIIHLQLYHNSLIRPLCLVF